jgi:hypothetical protein
MSIRILSTLTDKAYQTVSFDTNKGERVDITLRFIPSQETWFFDIESASLTVRGLALTAFKNLLDPYHNLISWGMYVWTEDGFDPWRIDDFSTGRVRIAIIEDLENAVIEEFLNG